MTKITRIFLALSLSPIFADVARAGLYVEPMAGYQKVTNNYTYKPANGGASDKIDVTGITYGGELGWAFQSGFRLGGQYELGNFEAKYETLGITRKLTGNAALLIIGYKFPKDIIGYLGIGQATTVDDQSPKVTATGQILKAGASHEFVKHIAVSAEWVMYSWNESTTEGSSAVKISDTFDKYLSNGVQANIRFPFEF